MARLTVGLLNNLSEIQKGDTAMQHEYTNVEAVSSDCEKRVLKHEFDFKAKIIHLHLANGIWSLTKLQSQRKCTNSSNKNSSNLNVDM